MQKKGKLFLIGIDGATFDVVDPLIKAGRLPNIKKMIEAGVSAPLRSSVPPLSPVAWTSISTGSNPALHGIIDFVVYDKIKRSGMLYDTGHRRVKPVWTVLGEQGMKSCVVNVPLTFPVDPVNGFMTSGLGTPPTNERFAHPQETYDAMLSEIGTYLVDVDMREGGNDPAIVAADLKKVMKARKAALTHLLKKEEWDLFYFVFTNTDRAQHFFWKYYDKKHPAYTEEGGNRFGQVIPDTYAEVDAAVGQVMEQMGPEDTIVLVSDHGFGSLETQFSLSCWLHKEGYLHLRPGVKLKKPSAIKNGIKRLIPVSVFKFIIKNIFKDKWKFKGNLSDVDHFLDWQKTRVFSHKSFDTTFLYFNDGLIPTKDERAKVLTEIQQKLLALKDPQTGKRVFVAVEDGHDVFGSDTAEVPDIVLTPEVKYNLSFEFRDMQNPSPFGTGMNWSGGHDPLGIFVINGPNVKQGVKLDEASVVDIVPTACFLLQSALPSTVNGRLLKEAFTDDFIKGAKTDFGEINGFSAHGDGEMSDEEAKALQEHLKNLGYL